MKSRTNKLMLGIAMALATPSLALAEGFYATVLLGFSKQASDSEPYGNNIALDADFPGEFDAGDSAVGGIGLGYKFNDQLRLEGRIAFREGSFDERHVGTGERDGEEYILNGDISSTTLTVEGFYDFQNQTSFTPYLKAGIGVSDNSYSARLGGAGVADFDAFDGATDGYYDAYSDGDSSELSWNVGFGANFELSERISIYAEYQYATFGDVETGQDSFTDGFKIDNISTNEVAAGLSVRF